MAKEIGSATNGYDKQKVELHVKQIEAKQAEIDEINLDAKESCLPYREELKQIRKKACKDIGCKAEILNAAVRQRKFERKAGAVRGGLDQDDQSSFDIFMDALGPFANTPLGEAALADAA